MAKKETLKAGKVAKKAIKDIKKNQKAPTHVETAKELLDVNDLDSLAVVTKFSITEIKMKNDWRWKITMKVHETLPEGKYDYGIKLEFDDRPYLKNIQQLEKEVSDIKEVPTMLPDIDKADIKKLNEKIAKIKAEMEKLAGECTDIDFVARTEQIKWVNNETALYFKVQDNLIEQLNEQKYRLGEYRAILTPIFNK